ncbi:hypothetical protein B0F90DRAFT_1781272 [Multifurca ochricompacta]|uniref:Uncharacterized protein n=1 Tax=Multifurca ochricompacta TaxID=376703 RepID=A0AAD4LVC7_9AGAM|nr:hypothetical protein B0F90DRAFT_1781272 [Multifurca ochricompacta]
MGHMLLSVPNRASTTTADFGLSQAQHSRVTLRTFNLATWKVPNIKLTVYEKERGIGGTWFVNRYPLRVIFPSIFSLQSNPQ